MATRLTKEAARAWKRRWKAVGEFEREELRRTPVDTKLRQITALMGLVDLLGWRQALSADDERVRALWKSLRDRHRESAGSP